MALNENLKNHAWLKEFVIPSSRVNLLTDEVEVSGEDEDFIDEGIVGKKFIALKPYIMDKSTSKDFKELDARTYEKRKFLHRSEIMP